MSTTIEIKIRRELNGAVDEHVRTVTVGGTDNPRFVAYAIRPKAQTALDQVIRCFGDPDDVPGRPS